MRKFPLTLLLAFLALTLLLSTVSAQPLIWEHTWGGESEDFASGVAVDRYGNSYMVGYTASFGAGESDAFIAKFSSSGALLWDRTWGGDHDEESSGIILDELGNVYVTGCTSSFGDSDLDAFIAVFNNDGDLKWDLIWDSGIDDLGEGVALDSYGNIYICGETYNSTPPLEQDAFIAKFNTSGVLQWSRTWGGSGFDKAVRLLIDKKNNIYVVGDTYSLGAGPNDVFIAKFSPNGDLIWDLTWGTGAQEYVGGASIDDMGNIYIAGTTDAFYGTRSYDVFVVKFDSDGNLLWNLVWGGSSIDECYDMALDKFGNIYVVGRTKSSGPSYDGFLLKLDPSGGIVEQIAWGGEDSDVFFSIDINAPFISMVGETKSQIRNMKNISGTIIDISATIIDPNAEVKDPEATVDYPVAYIGDPSATLDSVVQEEAWIVQFRILIPVGGMVLPPQVGNPGYELIQVIVEASITIMIITAMITIKCYRRK